jgi:hypothetical protein
MVKFDVPIVRATSTVAWSSSSACTVTSPSTAFGSWGDEWADMSDTLTPSASAGRPRHLVSVGPVFTPLFRMRRGHAGTRPGTADSSTRRM